MNEIRKTADAVAAIRYVATRSDRSWVFDDPYAEVFLSRTWRLLLFTRLQRCLLTKIYNRWVPGMIGDVLIRSRYVQDLLLSQEWRQFVIVGGGWDSTALRLADRLGDARVFELESPGMHKQKLERLAAAGLELPANVTQLPMDFERPGVAEVLRSSDFDPELPTLFFWGGATFYLEREVMLETVRDIAACSAAGSELVFDYLDERLFHDEPPFFGGRHLAAMARRRGEPFRCGFYPQDLLQLLREAGLEPVQHLVGVEQRQLHSHETIGIFPPSEYIHLMHARVVQPEPARQPAS